MNRHITKILFTAVIAFLILVDRSRSSEQRGNAKERAKWRMSTMVAARRFSDSLTPGATITTADRTLLMEKLTTSITSDVASHAKKKQSKIFCEKTAQEFYQELLNKKLLNIARELSTGSPLPITTNDIKRQLGSDWDKKIQIATDRFIHSDFNQIFRNARKTAVALARQKLDESIQLPAQEKLDQEFLKLSRKHPKRDASF